MASGAGPPPEDEDVVDSVIRRSGCEDKYRAMEDCLAFKTNRDFKACTQVMKEFQSCMKTKQHAASPRDS